MDTIEGHSHEQETHIIFHEFKAKVALETIRGDETIPRLAARYEIHSTQINSWKRQLIEQAAELFSRKTVQAKRTDTPQMIYIEP